MSNIDFYRVYIGLKLHFKSEGYNFKVQQGYIKKLKEKFVTDKAYKFFKAAAERYTIDEWKFYCMANFIFNPHIHISNLLKEECLNNYLKWKAWNSNRQLAFTKDIETMFSKKIYDVAPGQNRLEKIQNIVSISTKLCVNQVIGFDTLVYMFIFFPKRVEKGKILEKDNPKNRLFFTSKVIMRIRKYLLICQIKNEEKKIFRLIIKRAMASLK